MRITIAAILTLATACWAGIHGKGAWVQRDIYDPWDANVLEAGVWVYNCEIMPGDANYYQTLAEWAADAMPATGNVAGRDGNRVLAASELWAECFDAEVGAAYCARTAADTATRFVRLYAAPGAAQDGTNNPHQGARISNSLNNLNQAALQFRGMNHWRVTGIRFNADPNYTALCAGINAFTRYPSSPTSGRNQGAVIQNCYFGWNIWQYHSMPVRLEWILGSGVAGGTVVASVYLINNIIDGNACAVGSAQGGNYGVWVSPTATLPDGNAEIDVHLDHCTIAGLTNGASGAQSTMVSAHHYLGFTPQPVDPNWTSRSGTYNVRFHVTNTIACQRAAADAPAFASSADANFNCFTYWDGNHNVSHDGTAFTYFGNDATAEPNRLLLDVFRGLHDLRLTKTSPAYRTGAVTLQATDALGRPWKSPPDRGALLLRPAPGGMTMMGCD